MSSRVLGDAPDKRPGYLVRFDDICPTMNWQVWAEIEQALDAKGIRPILAVVPDNQDPQLAVGPPAADFWARVRAWQTRGWGIGLHGYQHRYVSDQSGLMRLIRQSEFAGLPRGEQERKLRAGLAIFEREGVVADCWVAPSHSFDWTTVKLLSELGIRAISDGLWPWPHTDRSGITWVPQQLWGGLRDKGPGVWTLCLHHNRWNHADLERLRRDLARLGSQMLGLDEVVQRFAERRLTLADRLAARWDFFRNHQVRPTLYRLWHGLRGGC